MQLSKALMDVTSLALLCLCIAARAMITVIVVASAATDAAKQRAQPCRLTSVPSGYDGKTGGAHWSLATACVSCTRGPKRVFVWIFAQSEITKVASSARSKIIFARQPGNEVIGVGKSLNQNNGL
eukprot:5112402-Amphidinium_carterae.1